MTEFMLALTRYVESNGRFQRSVFVFICVQFLFDVVVFAMLVAR